MSRYPEYHHDAQHNVRGGHAPDAGAFHTGLRPAHDHRGSRSPSDDGTAYLLYSKNEIEFEGQCCNIIIHIFATYRLTRLLEDPNASLIAQTLNTDGTPKRPMNAFMIFARRRRPQVSAENQSMRTGEISKILSKEWNAMELVSIVSLPSVLNWISMDGFT